MWGFIAKAGSYEYLYIMRLFDYFGSDVMKKIFFFGLIILFLIGGFNG